MNSKLESQGSRADSLKLGIAVLLLGAAVVAFHYYADQSTLVRVLGLLGIALVSVFIAYHTAFGRGTVAFMQESRAEVRKVVWPTRTETTQTTLAVILIVLLVGIFLWLLDMVLFWAVHLLTGGGA
jgi:preprotein translocase subunit SecE